MTEHEARSPKDLFVRALELPAAGRAAFLEEACGGDHELRAEVERLLTANDEAGEFLSEPTIDVESDPTPDAPTVGVTPSASLAELRRGTKIGPYKLLEEIGAGGFGAVYMAEQEKPVRRKVALKVIKLGMDTRDVIARFEAERQALAMMDHPNIAKVLDAGATDAGRPYFVMELVKGVPITEYCDVNQLTTPERLELFVTACQALQHAHHKGVIHRDIKPSNILVTLHDGQPVPKVIDFGIAKATNARLTEKTVFTEFRQMIGTPVYMSPEQAEMSGLDVDTRSDIYSLGVLLYELLTGTTPVDAEELMKSGYGEIQRIIREQEPPKPSTRVSTLERTGLTAVAKHRSVEPEVLGKLLRGDLDWIVMKALEKDRTRRYETASEFAADIRRHLADEPVEASPPSAAYRLHKLFRRHRREMAATAAVLVALLVGLVVSTVLYFKAESATRDAILEREMADAARLQEQAARETAESERRAADEARRREADARQAAEAARGEAEAALERAERSLYFNRIALAERYWLANNAAATEKVLEECPPERRHWEWRYLKRLGHGEVKSLTAHENYEVAYSPDGELFAMTGPDATVILLDRQTWKEKRRLEHRAAVGRIAFSGSGRRLVTASVDETVHVWDVMSGLEVTTLQGHEGRLADVAISKDGTRVAAATRRTAPLENGGHVVLPRPGELKVWDIATDEALLTVTRAGVQVAMSPDGTRVASVWEDPVGLTMSLGIWDVTTGDVAVNLGFARVSSPDLAFSDDGRWLLRAKFHDAELWDLESGERVRTFTGHESNILHVAFNHDGTRVATAEGTGTMKIWEAMTGKELFSYRGHRAPIGCISLSPDGLQLASSSSDGTVRLWDATRRAGTRTLKSPLKGATCFAFSPDGSRVAFSGYEVIGFFARFGGRTSGEVAVCDLDTGEKVLSLKPRGRKFKPGPAPRYKVTFSPDGRWLASGNPGGTINLWEAETGKDAGVFEGHAGHISDLCFNPKGTLLAAVDEGAREAKHSGGGVHIARVVTPGSIRVREVPSGKERMVLPGDMSRVECLSFSPDGGLLAAANTGSGATTVWHIDSGREVLKLAGHDGSGGRKVTTVAFRPDGRQLATASWDETVRLWDAATGEELFTLEGHTTYVRGLAYTPDGGRLASVGDAVKLWDTRTGQEILTLDEGRGRGTSAVAFTPDGNLLATMGRGRMIIWNAAPVE